jgi:hypothetical protein
MVNALNLTFKKVILLSVLTVLLGVSFVYAIGYEFKPKSSTQTGPTSSTFTPTGFIPPGIAPFYSGHLVIFAYNGSNQSDGSSSFVQASVTVTGSESHNGTTTTDSQNPLIFTVTPGEYSVFGTYDSASPQNETVNVTSGSYCDAFLNFGSVRLPSLGHILVTAWYTSKQSSGELLSYFVQASVTVTGSESHNGTTTTDYYDPLIFTVTPGEYSVFGTYDSASPQNVTVNVTPGSYSGVFLSFGNSPFPPPP